MSFSIAPVLIDREVSTSGVAFVQGVNGSSSVSLTLTTAGNLIVIFIVQVLGASPAPTASGFTIDDTNFCTWGAGASNVLYYGYMVSPGGTVKPSPTAGAGAVAGLTIYEISGASTTVDAVSPAQTVTSTNTTSITSESMTTSNPGSIVLAEAATSGLPGTIDAWTGTGPMTNISNTFAGGSLGGGWGGYYIPGTTLSAATFTANWTTSRAPGIQAVAFKPAHNYASVAWLT